MPSAFVIVAGTVYGSQSVNIPGIPKKWLIATLLVVLFATTLQRSIIWQDDIKLCKDTLEKSPFSRDLRIAYSSVLIIQGEYNESLKQLEEARRLPFLGYDDRIDHNASYIYYKEGKLDDAIKISDSAFSRSHGKLSWPLENILLFLVEKKRSRTEKNERYLIDKQIFFYQQQLYQLNHDPHQLYQLAVQAEALGDKKESLKLFRQVSGALADDDAYKKKTIKKIQSLSAFSNSAHAEYF